MKKILTKNTRLNVFYVVDGEKVYSLPPNLTGDISGLTGDISALTGYISSGLTGDISGLTGDIDDCELTISDRAAGVNVADLIAD